MLRPKRELNPTAAVPRDWNNRSASGLRRILRFWTTPATFDRMRLGWLCMRVFWILLAAIHVWPAFLLTHRLFAEPTSANLASLGLLALLLPVLVLKAIDARVLRSSRPRRELVVLLVSTGLVHGGVPTTADVESVAPQALVLATAISAIAIRRIRKRLPEWLSDLVDRLATPMDGIAPMIVGSLEVPRLAGFPGIGPPAGLTPRPPPAN